MVVKNGEKFHVVVRRGFESDIRRHFVGEVEEFEGSIVRLIGYPIVFDKTKNVFVKGSHKRTTVMDLAESGYIVNGIPGDVDISELKYKYDSERKLLMTDDKSYSLDIIEFGIGR
jgi:hypothetical protein